MVTKHALRPRRNPVHVDGMPIRVKVARWPATSSTEALSGYVASAAETWADGKDISLSELRSVLDGEGARVTKGTLADLRRVNAMRTPRRIPG